MAELSARVLFGGQARTHGTGTDYKQSPVGIFFGTQQAEPFTLPDDAIVWYDPGSGYTSDTLAQGTQAVIWGSSTILLNNLTTDYVLFSTPGSKALYAARQQDYPLIMRATTVIPLWDLRGRTWKRRQLLPPRTATAYCWSGGLSFINGPWNVYATDATGNLGDVKTPIFTGGSSWPVQTAGANRIVASETGAVLLQVDNGTVWFSATPDVVPFQQVIWQGGPFEQCDGVNYNRVTKTWVIASGFRHVYYAAAAVPLIAADWTLMFDYATVSDRGGYDIAVGPDGDVILENNSPVMSWYAYVTGIGTIARVALSPSDGAAMQAVHQFGVARQIFLAGRGSVYGTITLPDDPALAKPGGIMDSAGTFDQSLLHPVYACPDPDNLGQVYCLNATGDLYHRPGPTGTAWVLVLAGAVPGQTFLLQPAYGVAGELTAIAVQHAGALFAPSSVQVCHIQPTIPSVTYDAPFTFTFVIQNDIATGDSYIASAACSI